MSENGPENRINRWSAKRKTEVVLQLLRGEELDAVSRKIQVPAHEIELAYDTVQRKVSSGEWPNPGEKGSPRVRRCDVLPGLDTPKPGDASEPVDALAEKVCR